MGCKDTTSVERKDYMKQQNPGICVFSVYGDKKS